MVITHRNIAYTDNRTGAARLAAIVLTQPLHKG